MTSETGKIDINAADRTLISGLARALGIPADKADAIGDAVVDWRDPDDIPQPHGAERQAYSAADRAYGPSNRSFRDVEELRYVLPVDNAAYGQMAPYLTVYSGKGQPDPKLAPAVVLTALAMQRQVKGQGNSVAGSMGSGLPGAGRTGASGGSTTADATVQGQTGATGAGLSPGIGAQPAGPTSTPQPGQATAGGGGAAASQAGTVYTISLDVRLPGGYENHARAVVALAADQSSNVLRVLDWASALPAPAG